MSVGHLHINSLVFFPSKFGLKPFVKEENVHAKLLSKHTSTVHDINWALANQYHITKPSVKPANG